MTTEQNHQNDGQTNSRTPTGQGPQRKAPPNPDSPKNPARQGGRTGDDDEGRSDKTGKNEDE